MCASLVAAFEKASAYKAKTDQNKISVKNITYVYILDQPQIFMNLFKNFN